MSQSNIQENLDKIRAELPENVLLVAVSKTRTVEEIRWAAACGCRDFGENKAQELYEKYAELPDLRWHFIGRLQKNKVKSIVGKVCLIHSVDSLPLALEINKRAEVLGIVQDILIQVNAAGEPQKGGVSLENTKLLFSEISEKCSSVRIRGLMQVAPEAENPEDVRIYFQQVYQLQKDLGLEILSMGMSGDYKVAIEEGANCVRIGSAIFGQRVYKLSEV